MHEEEISVHTDDITLAGTLCTPGRDNKYPTVLMVHGSGPVDRNENTTKQQLNVFNAIAQALAAQGIASLRYDKRGCGASAGDYLSTGHTELVQDATRCLDFLASSDRVAANGLFILGHSEGAVIAPQVAQQRPAVAGLILLCPFVEDFEALLHRQAAQLEQEVNALDGAAGFFTRLLFRLIGQPTVLQRKLLKKIHNTDAPVIRKGLKKIPAKWFRELLALDAEAIFSSTHTPMLLIGGAKDLQCNPEDIFKISEVAPGATETMLIEDMTHLLRVDQNPASILASARLTDQPIEAVVTEKTVRWVTALCRAASQPWHS